MVCLSERAYVFNKDEIACERQSSFENQAGRIRLHVGSAKKICTVYMPFE